MNSTNSIRKLDVLIATHGDEGLLRIAEMQLPKVAGVHYIVTWQTAQSSAANPLSSDMPDELIRDDIEIHRLSSAGLSNNRNAGIELAIAPYCLIADNDLHYYPEGLQTVIDTLEANPEVDIATFRHDGEPVSYPSAVTDFTAEMPRGYSVTSFETAFRRQSIGSIRFDTNFGIGAPLACCEDSLFILDCRHAGLRCRFFPITIVAHRGLSTGLRPITDPRTAMGEGAYIRLAYGLVGYARIPLFAWRASRKKRMSFLFGLLHLSRGFFSRHVHTHYRLTKKWHNSK